MTDKLPDLLRPKLNVVFCGTAAGRRSAQQGYYYAKPGNRFWPALAAVGLTNRRLEPEEFRELLDHGIGLTDLAKKASGMDTDLQNSDFDIGGFEERLLATQPRFIAFNGKQAAAAYLRTMTSKIGYGRLGQQLGSSSLWVLPSTSGAASGYWTIEPWRALADAIRGIG